MKAKNKFRHEGEAIALAFLQRCGQTLLHYNYKTPWSEIDLITIDQEFILHAVEVKSWNSKSMLYHPLEFFSDQRIHKIRTSMQKFVGDFTEDMKTQLILVDLGCTTPLKVLDFSFDLIWNRDKDYIEYHPQLF